MPDRKRRTRSADEYMALQRRSDIRAVDTTFSPRDLWNFIPAMGLLEWIVRFLTGRVVGVSVILFLGWNSPCVDHGPPSCQGPLSTRHPTTEWPIVKNGPAGSITRFVASATTFSNKKGITLTPPVPHIRNRNPR